MAISAFVQRFLLVHSNDRHSKAVEWDEGDVHAGVVVVESPAVVLVAPLPVVDVESLPVVVVTLVPGVSQGVSMIRSKRISVQDLGATFISGLLFLRQTRQHSPAAAHHTSFENLFQTQLHFHPKDCSEFAPTSKCTFQNFS